jgi:hypothetical protein
LLLHRTGGAQKDMSTTAVSTGNVDVQHGSTQIFVNTNQVTAASGSAPWTLTLVLRDKPDEDTLMSVAVWSQNPACGTASTVPPTQRYAGGVVTVPPAGALQLNGVTMTIPGTGVPARALGNGEKLCFSMTPVDGGGKNDVHFVADRAALLGLLGSKSALSGPMNGG